MIQYTEDQEAHEAQALAINEKTNIEDKPLWMTCEGFICFKPSLAEPKKDDDGNDGSYEVAIALPVTSAVAKDLVKRTKAYKLLKFDKARNIREPFKKGDDYLESRLADADAEEAKKVKASYGNLAGHIFFNASTKFALNEEGRAAQLVDEYGKELDASKVNGGDIVRIQVAPFSYNKPGNKGVAFGLRSMQVLRSGDYSGGAGGDTAGAFSTKVDKEDAAAAFTKPATPETADDAEPLDDASMFN